MIERLLIILCALLLACTLIAQGFMVITRVQKDTEIKERIVEKQRELEEKINLCIAREQLMGELKDATK